MYIFQLSSVIDNLIIISSFYPDGFYYFADTMLPHKPANFKSPEKLSFKDKLALHQKKVANVSKEVETELLLKRRSWAPSSSPYSSRSNTTSPVVSPTRKYFSSASVGTPPVLRCKYTFEVYNLLTFLLLTNSTHFTC